MVDFSDNDGSGMGHTAHQKAASLEQTWDEIPEYSLEPYIAE
jgi:hypothetical protein